LQGHVLGDEAHDVRRAAHLLDEPLREGHQSFSSTIVTPAPPSLALPGWYEATWGCPSSSPATALRSRPAPKPWMTRIWRRSESAASSRSLSTRGTASSTVRPTR